MSDRGAATISDAARAAAVSMLRFDPELTSAQIEAIVRRIDALWDLGADLRSPSAPLANGDEPVTHFTVFGPPVG